MALICQTEVLYVTHLYLILCLKSPWGHVSLEDQLYWFDVPFTWLGTTFVKTPSSQVFILLVKTAPVLMPSNWICGGCRSLDNQLEWFDVLFTWFGTTFVKTPSSQVFILLVKTAPVLLPSNWICGGRRSLDNQLEWFDVSFIWCQITFVNLQS